MDNKWKKLILLMVGGFLFSVIFTGIVYYFFPQYLCYAVYDASEGNLYQAEEEGMASGRRLTEYFTPRHPYFTGVSIGVKREKNDNMVVGRLLDAQGKVVAESRFSLRDADYTLYFHRWVEPGQQYQLEILFPKENQSEVMVTFGPEDSGAGEQEASYVDGEPSDRVPYVCYIYGTYSRKLLAFWFMVFFLGGFMIGETVLYKFTLHGGRPAQK